MEQTLYQKAKNSVGTALLSGLIGLSFSGCGLAGRTYIESTPQNKQECVISDLEQWRLESTIEVYAQIGDLEGWRKASTKLYSCKTEPKNKHSKTP